MVLREIFALQLTISRDWLNRHSTNLEPQLSKAFRRPLNAKQDLLLFTDFKTAKEVLSSLRKRKNYHESVKARKRLLTTAGKHSLRDIRRLWEIQEGKCYYTGKSLGRTFKTAKFAKDHIIPLSKNGVNTAYNIALCLSSVNVEKGNRNLKDFIKKKKIPQKQRGIMLLIDARRTSEFYKIAPMKPKVVIGRQKISQYASELETSSSLFKPISSLRVDLQKFFRDTNRT